MEVHGFIGLLTGLWFHEAGATALDLDLAARLLLDILDIVATTTNDLSTQIESTNRLETDRDLLLGPFALIPVSFAEWILSPRTYSAKLVTFKVFWFATTESAFIYKIREILFHHFFNHGNGLVQAFFGRASDAKIQRWVLQTKSVGEYQSGVRETYSNIGHVLVRVVFSSCSDILRV